MIKHNQDGAANGLMISLILAVLLLIGAIGFGGWAFTQMQDYKNNVDQKVAAANKIAVAKESERKDKIFAEEAKKPFKTYSGPDTYGSLHIEYPKTWSGYVDDTGTGQALVDGYFAPGEVPSASNKSSVFALRVQVVNQPYSFVMQNFANQQKSGVVAVSAYALPKLPKIVGAQVSGKVFPSSDKTATLIVLPLRSSTLEIWTDGTQYLEDFNKNILPNFSFSP